MTVRLLTALWIAVVLVAAAAAAAPARGASLGGAPAIDEQASRQITVDGRAVTISVTARALGLVTSPNVPGPSPTGIRVDLRSADGQDLPEISAVRVKVERVRAPARVYRSPLFPILTFAADPLNAGYEANITSFRPGALLKATVTIQTRDGVRTLRIGQLRVGSGPLPFEQPDLTE